MNGEGGVKKYAIWLIWSVGFGEIKKSCRSTLEMNESTVVQYIDYAIMRYKIIDNKTSIIVREVSVRNDCGYAVDE